MRKNNLWITALAFGLSLSAYGQQAEGGISSGMLQEIKQAYKQVERISGEKLLSMLPEALRTSYQHLIQEDDPETLPIVKAADKLSAYIKCVEELKAGNQEFESAARQTMAAMKAMDLPELTYFLEEFLPAFSLNLDQLE